MTSDGAKLTPSESSPRIRSCKGNKRSGLALRPQFVLINATEGIHHFKDNCQERVGSLSSCEGHKIHLFASMRHSHQIPLCPYKAGNISVPAIYVFPATQVLFLCQQVEENDEGTAISSLHPNLSLPRFPAEI